MRRYACRWRCERAPSHRAAPRPARRRRGPASRSAAARARSPAGWRRPPSAHSLGHDLVDDLPLVERHPGSAADLIGLVTLAREEHEVTWTSEIQRAGDGVASVLDALVRHAVH